MCRLDRYRWLNLRGNSRGDIERAMFGGRCMLCFTCFIFFVVLVYKESREGDVN